MKIPFLLGRLIFGGFFLYNGIHHLQDRKILAKYLKSRNVPAADAAIISTAVMQLAGGASLLAGVKPKYGAALIAGFLAGVSPIMHNFWSMEDPDQRMNNMENFAKNLALLGAALALMAVEEPWPVSVPLAKPTAGTRLRKLMGRVAA